MIHPFILTLLLFLTSSFACPDGTIQGLDANSCYKFISSLDSTWYDAERTCISNGGHLASISSALENNLIWNEAKNYFTNAPSFWMGSNNILLTFNWTWSDASDFKYTKWAFGEPNINTTQAFYCLNQNISSGSWAPDICANKKPFVCKVPKNGPPCTAGWTYYNVTNSCYKLINGSNFTDVRSQCESQGGNLASIHNSLQGAVVSSLASFYSRFYVWIGFYFPMANNWWGWTDGTSVNYLNWAAGEPNNLRGYQCARLETANNWTHTWKADLCDNWNYYKDAVCVKNPLF